MKSKLPGKYLACVALLLLCITGCAPGARRADVGLDVRTIPAAQGPRLFSQPATPHGAVARLSGAAPSTGGSGATGAASEYGLEIHVFNVGQADSMLVVGPPPARRTLLVDAGEPASGKKTMFRQVAQRIREITGGARLDYFVATHYHSDHLGGEANGLAGLIDQEGITIDTAIDVGDEGAQYMAPSRGTFETYNQEMSRWLASGSVQLRARPRFGVEQIQLGDGVSVNMVEFAGRVSDSDPGAFAAIAQTHPQQYADAPGNENDLSIAMIISYGDFELFTGGDLNGGQPRADGSTPLFTTRSFGEKQETYTNVEHHLVNYWRQADHPVDVEIYRADHHGSSYSSTPELVNCLDPEFIVYSCGGLYGHPERPVVERGVQTAGQVVTTSVSRSTWKPRSSFEDFGRIVGEVEVDVDRDGKWYWINGELHKAYTEEEEQPGFDVAGGRGDDVGEESRTWVEEID